MAPIMEFGACNMSVMHAQAPWQYHCGQRSQVSDISSISHQDTECCWEAAVQASTL